MPASSIAWKKKVPYLSFRVVSDTIEALTSLRPVFSKFVSDPLCRDFYQREGVPQGSVLSVVLFILKINDIVRQLPPTAKGTLFVDVFQISCASVNMSTVERQLQIAIRKISDWTNNNGFVISNQKTFCMHFFRKRGLHPDPEITLNGVALPVRTEAKFLGIFDRKLTFLPHIQHLRQKCKGRRHAS
ncbi:hypothetical protein JTE90_007445 [Oedothorax gibbosus]|uniref:Reverse transcriptase domain-containing protein n=1 Tax=Oedothorax gibbosus TaxID=931172 RepID=A0AAV6UPE8_9ARAC|nr:hypothetical protein JTE90_007445 [Oedothorax gibbosus]